MRKILEYIKLFICMILLFNLLLLLSSLFPSEILKNNVIESADILLNEGNHFTFDFVNIRNNNYTDALIVNMLYSIDNQTPIQSYILGRKNYNKDFTKKIVEATIGEAKSIKPYSENEFTDKYDAVGELYNFVNEKIFVSMKYERYWHGWLTFYRALMILLNVAEIRILLLIILAILFIILIYKLAKEFGFGISFLFAYVLIVYDYFFVSYSLESSPIFILMMVMSIIILKYSKRIDIAKCMFLVGMIANFIDFLTVPLISIVIPIYIYILALNKQNIEKITIIKKVIASVVLWGCGYAFTWIFKWIVCELLIGKGSFIAAVKQVLYRSAQSNPETTITLGDTLIRSLIKVFIHISFILLVIGILISKRKVEISLMKIKENKWILCLIGALSLLPLMWYLVLGNHTILHYFFVYRHMMIFMLGNFLIIYNCLKVN
ncbi:MAG: hypothetical protein IJX99_04410 [Clostridia bacterium]|nr:hypothetical protein [Clostridia bacterium]